MSHAEKKLFKILVADDEPEICAILKLRLESNGYLVSSADNCTEAFNKVRRERPDLVILDMMMPDIGGIELCKMIKNEPGLEKTPVFLISAAADLSGSPGGNGDCSDGKFVKPLETKKLLERIAMLLK